MTTADLFANWSGVGRPRIPIADRLLKYRSISESGCWEWTGYRAKGGYGGICLWDGARRTTVSVSRVSAAVFMGFELDSDLIVCHKCDNPPCFNPDHLFIGTCLDNNRDMMSKGRNYFPLGSDRGHAKLTASDVLEIRKQRAAKVPCSALAQAYNVHPHTIWLAGNGKNWKHLNEV
jgi:hypothetical protein